MKMVKYLNVIRQVLNNLSIKYREVRLNNKTLFLCTTPYGRTFNLRFENNMAIKIWSFIGTAPIERAGMRYERKNENNSYPIGGVEITDDGDLSFYLADILDFDEMTSKDIIQNLIKTYVNMTPYILSQSFKL